MTKKKGKGKGKGCQFCGDFRKFLPKIRLNFSGF